MKHQEEILRQRLLNAKSGIANVQGHIDYFRERLMAQIKNDTLNIKFVEEEIEEIKDLLTWIENQ